MQYKQIKEMVRFCAVLTKENLVKKGDTISMRLMDGLLITDPEKSLSDITESDIIKVPAEKAADGVVPLHRAVYHKRNDVNAIIINRARYCEAAASSEIKSLPAVLDDMAQIIGPAVRIAKSADPQTVVKTLKGRNACLIKDAGSVAVGRTLDEAHTGALVLEKGAQAFIEGTILGGAERIRLWEALLMRFVYKKKYSKADQTAKMEELNL